MKPNKIVIDQLITAIDGFYFDRSQEGIIKYLVNLNFTHANICSPFKDEYDSSIHLQ